MRGLTVLTFMLALFVAVGVAQNYAYAQDGTGEGAGGVVAVDTPADEMEVAVEPDLEIPVTGEEPTDVDEAIETGQEVIAAVKSGRWYTAVAGVALVVMFMLRKSGIWKDRKELAYWVLLGLGVIAAAATAATNGSWSEGIAAALAAMGAPQLAQAVTHGPLKRPQTSRLSNGS